MTTPKKLFLGMATFSLLFSVLVVGIFVTFTHNVHASTSYYVSGTNGNDTWSGTIPDPNTSNTDGPFKTLTRAQSAMQTSSTIKTATIRAGTYSIQSTNLLLRWQDDGETWIPYSGETVILDGGGAGYVENIGAKNLTFEGLVFQNLGLGPKGPGMYLNGSGHTIRWNKFLNCKNSCFSGSSLTNAVIDSNMFDGQSPGNPPGSTASAYAAIELWYGSSNNKITHNLIQNAQGGGIAFANGPSDPPNNNNIVDRNILRNVNTNVVDNGAIYMMDRTHSAVGNQITNNIIDGNGGYTTQTTMLTDNWTKSLYLDDLMSNVLVSGNICRGCGEYGIQYHGGDHNTVKNNIFDLSAGGSELGFYQTVTGSSGMRDNTFTNNIIYSSGNFHNPLWNVGIGPSDSLPANNTNLYYSATNASIPNADIIDTSPVYANPQFFNPSAGNYSMPSNSPAYTQINFQTLPTDQGPLPSPFSDTTPPSVPTGLTGTAVSSTQINLTWNASTDNVGVTGYNVFRSGTQVGTSATTAYSDTGLSPGTTYSYTVSAFDAAGNTSAQSGVSITTQPSTLTPTFSIGSRVKTTTDLNVRSKPSTAKNSKTICTQPIGALGTITSGPTISSGYTWWKVNYDVGCNGWSAETYLALVTTTTANTPFSNTLAIGSRGKEVSTLQSLLAKIGFYSYQITGYFGAITQSAVMNFQSANNLAAVGIVGPKTRALLSRVVEQ